MRKKSNLTIIPVVMLLLYGVLVTMAMAWAMYEDWFEDKRQERLARRTHLAISMMADSGVQMEEYITNTRPPLVNMFQSDHGWYGVMEIGTNHERFESVFYAEHELSKPDWDQYQCIAVRHVIYHPYVDKWSVWNDEAFKQYLNASAQ